MTLCNPMDCNLPGSSVHGIFQVRVLEWVAIAFSHTGAIYITKNIIPIFPKICAYSPLSYKARVTIPKC